jgi:WD40 repeat protein
MPGSFVFQNKISAVRDTNGKVGGTIEGIVSLGDEATSAVAPNEGYRFKGVVTCLVVDGQNAWIGATITETNSSLVRQGDRWLGLVRDRGSSGADVMHSEVTRDGSQVTCLVRPRLSETVLDFGDFVVRGPGPEANVAERRGSLELNVATLGFDTDPDGYTLGLNSWRHPIRSRGALLLSSVLPPAKYQVRLDGVAANCRVQGDNPRSVNVLAGRTIDVSFSVDCRAIAGVVRVTTTTTGADVDANGYYVDVLEAQGRPGARIAPNGSLTLTGLRGGYHTLELSDVAPNCDVQGGSTYTFQIATPGQIVDVNIAVTCAAFGTLQVAAQQSGADPGPYDFKVAVRSERYQSDSVAAVAPNGAVSFQMPSLGAHQIWLRGVPANCDGTLLRDVSVLSAATASVTFNVTCVPPSSIAYASMDPADRSDIVMASSNGRSGALLTRDSGSERDPAWSPDGSRLAFAADRTGDFEIWVMNADGTGQVRLTSSPRADYRPDWSPDGKRIVFVSERDGNPELYVMNADGTGQLRLTNEPRPDGDPAWSPDGAQIAFRSERGSNAEIYIMNVDGSGVTRFTNDLAWDAHPAWSPDGKRLAFTRSVCTYLCTPQVVVATTPNAPVTFIGPGEDPSWSPNGKQIAVTGTVCDDSFYYYGCTNLGIRILTVDPIRSGDVASAPWDLILVRGNHVNPSWRR